MRKKMTRPAFIQIPTPLITDKGLMPLDSIVFGYVWWLSRLGEKGCIASNKTIAELCGASSGSIRNSLTRLDRQGHIHREFEDEIRQKRLKIIPLYNTKGMSLNNDIQPLDNAAGLSSDSEHNNSSLIKESRKGEDGLTSGVFGTKTATAKLAKIESAAEDHNAIALVKYLCEQKGMVRPDRERFSLIDARKFIDSFKEFAHVGEAGAIELAKNLIYIIAADDLAETDSGAAYHNENMTNMAYLVNNFNKLCHQFGLHKEEDGTWGFL